MDDKNWPRTSRAIADSERENQCEYDLTDDEEPDRGQSLLRMLAAESDGHIREMTPGRFYVSKLED
jgi:hypothetical protein